MEKDNNNKLVIFAIIAVIFVSVLSGLNSYNNMVSANENVTSAYADIDAQLQRRADLIPNLVNTVQAYMDYEKDVIDEVIASREKLLSASSLSEKAQASDALTDALKNLMVVVENYPDLKANTTFIQLQDELAGCENRIATARMDFNSAVEVYNKTIKKIPGVFFAKAFGFEEAEYFKAKEGSDQVPDVQFK